MGAYTGARRVQGPRPRSTLRSDNIGNIPNNIEPLRFGVFRPVFEQDRDALAAVAIDAVAETFPAIHEQRTMYMAALRDLQRQSIAEGDEVDAEALEAVAYSKRNFFGDEEPEDTASQVIKNMKAEQVDSGIVPWNELLARLDIDGCEFTDDVFYKWQRQLPYMSRFILHSEMGTTYASRERIGTAFRNNAETAYALCKKVDQLAEKLWIPNEPNQTVFLDPENIFWGGTEKRKLIVGIDKGCTAYRLMQEEADIMNSVFREYSDRLTGVFKAPDHITVGHYGAPQDGRGLNKAVEKRAIATGLQRHLGERAVYVCELLPLNFGETYNEPVELWAKAIDRQRSLRAA